jgi:uncharacterized flavoprotein (TIGR03862 family)
MGRIGLLLADDRIFGGSGDREFEIMTDARIGIVGGGPAGLMAAEVLSGLGHGVTVFEAMPTVGRKFLLAGKSGLNITHSEPYETFATRFGEAGGRLRPALDAFTPQDVRCWAGELGTETFVGTSGRVFPTVMKASPLLRAWRARLESRGVAIRTRHRLAAMTKDGLTFETPQGQVAMAFDAVLLALGGASWPKLGSDAAWVPWLRSGNVEIADFRPANCGFDVAWSDIFRERHAGSPVKAVVATTSAGAIPGEFVVTGSGIEGSLVYAHSAALRDLLAAGEPARLHLDLAPGRSLERLAGDLSKQHGKASFSSRLRKGVDLAGVKAGLLRECFPDASSAPFEVLARMIKNLPIEVLRPRPIAEAISSAGGIRFSAIDDRYMLQALPGTFVAGEMLDWEAPTGGYLLTACLATGRAAARGMDAWIKSKFAGSGVSSGR